MDSKKTRVIASLFSVYITTYAAPNIDLCVINLAGKVCLQTEMPVYTHACTIAAMFPSNCKVVGEKNDTHHFIVLSSNTDDLITSFNAPLTVITDEADFNIIQVVVKSIKMSDQIYTVRSDRILTDLIRYSVNCAHLFEPTGTLIDQLGNPFSIMLSRADSDHKLDELYRQFEGEITFKYLCYLTDGVCIPNFVLTQPVHVKDEFIIIPNELSVYREYWTTVFVSANKREYRDLSLLHPFEDLFKYQLSTYREDGFIIDVLNKLFEGETQVAEFSNNTYEFQLRFEIAFGDCLQISLIIKAYEEFINDLIKMGVNFDPTIHYTFRLQESRAVFQAVIDCLKQTCRH